MRVVHHDQQMVESALRAGQLRCPRCRGALRPWGRARPRRIRVGPTATRAVQPRRARCPRCRSTHVLLPEWMVARRAYSAPVIWNVVVAHARGLGYHRIAARDRLPETTVRDWLRALRHSPPEAVRSRVGRGHPARAVPALRRYARPSPAWRIAVRLTGGRMLVNTSPPRCRAAYPANPLR
jgi:hypothetical protein